MAKKYSELLKLAREAIKSEINGEELGIDETIKKTYSEKKACFVTLTLNGELRGCIGSLIARRELWEDVIENAKNAAFSDPRFDELTKEEMKKVKIEISVLSIPKKIEYKGGEDLKKRIKGKGVILQKGFYSATYLPQVWEDLPDTEEFLSSLCKKAGLAGDEWKKDKLKVSTYDAEKIRE